MTGLITFLAVVFGGIAIWAVIHMRGDSPKSDARPRLPGNPKTPERPLGTGMTRSDERQPLRAAPRRRS